MCIRDRVLEELNINIQGKIADSGKEVWGSTHAAPQAVVLDSRGIMQNFVPSVIGMGAVSYTHLDVYKRQPNALQILARL